MIRKLIHKVSIRIKTFEIIKEFDNDQKKIQNDRKI